MSAIEKSEFGFKAAHREVLELKRPMRFVKKVKLTGSILAAKVTR